MPNFCCDGSAIAMLCAPSVAMIRLSGMRVFGWPSAPSKKQCAAVKTHSGAMSDPPQRDSPGDSQTCHGQAPGWASWPPTMNGSSRAAAAVRGTAVGAPTASRTSRAQQDPFKCIMVLVLLSYAEECASKKTKAARAAAMGVVLAVDSGLPFRELARGAAMNHGAREAVNGEWARRPLALSARIAHDAGEQYGAARPLDDRPDEGPIGAHDQRLLAARNGAPQPDHDAGRCRRLRTFLGDVDETLVHDRGDVEILRAVDPGEIGAPLREGLLHSERCERVLQGQRLACRPAGQRELDRSLAHGALPRPRPPGAPLRPEPLQNALDAGDRVGDDQDHREVPADGGNLAGRRGSITRTDLPRDERPGAVHEGHVDRRLGRKAEDLGSGRLRPERFLPGRLQVDRVRHHETRQRGDRSAPEELLDLPRGVIGDPAVDLAARLLGGTGEIDHPEARAVESDEQRREALLD